MSEIVDVASSVSPVAGASIASATVGGIWWFICLHVSPAPQVGRFNAAYGIAILTAEVANLGSGYAIIRYFQVAPGQRQAIVRTALAATTVTTLLFVALLGALGEVAGAGGPLPRDLSTACAILLAALGTSWYHVTESLLLAAGRRGTMFARASFTAAGRVVLLLILRFLMPMTFEALLVSYTVPALVAAASASWVMRQEVFGGLRKGVLLSQPQVKRVLPYAFQSYAGNIVAAITPNILPILVVWRIGPIAGARFGAAWYIAGVVMLIPSAISLTTFSTVARGERRAEYVLRQGMRLQLAAQIPLIVGIAVLCPFVLPHLGSAYAHLGPPQTLPLLVGVVFIGLTGQVYSHARVLDGGLRVVIGGQVVQAAIVIPLAILLAPRMGVAGVSTAWLAGTAITLTLVLVIGLRCLLRPAIAQAHESAT